MSRPRAALLATSVAFSTVFATGVQAMTDTELQAIVAKRLHGDRTGACFAAAVIENDKVSRAYVCADGKDASGRVDANTVFEIGSVTKPMMSALLAGLIGEGKASLDDPLSAYLPEGAKAPSFGGNPILLRHLVTHTSGLPRLPSNLDEGGDMENPYAHYDERRLLSALAGTKLGRAPGAKEEYSNFAAMVLSYAIARRAGTDFETLLKQRVFAPLGMDKSYIGRKPEGVRVAVGHSPDAKPVSSWDFKTDLAGVGGVRSTLDDMVRYVQGQFGQAPKPLDEAFRLTHLPVANDAKAQNAMHWMFANLNGRRFLAHEGGTGGFSSFVAFDPAKSFGVVILSDTSLHSLGGLGSLGLHLLDPRVPLGEPALAQTRPSGPAPTLSEEDLQAYVGEYPLAPEFVLTVRAEGDRLTVQATGQGRLPLQAIAEDAFENKDVGAVIRFQRDAAGKVSSLELEQAGHTSPAKRK
jgi:serine-type D-Ala-D-Ala carboxypeptidase/endopeptidase